MALTETFLFGDESRVEGHRLSARCRSVECNRERKDRPMFTLYCADSELATKLAVTQAAAIIAVDAQTAMALVQWPAERLKHARCASLGLLADAAKPVLDWCWS